MTQIAQDNASQTATAEPRLFELVGDRPCARCHFNLSGQTVVREKHYGLLIVRCPECGTPAALQEYPTLGRWANRFAYLVAAGWLAVITALISAAALVSWGLSEEMSQQLASPYTAHVQKLWTEWSASAGPPNPYASYNYQQGADWWTNLDKKQVFADAGGWKRAIAWNALWLGADMLLILAPLGAILAVAMPHLRWRGWLLLALVVALLAGAFALLSATIGRGRYYYGSVPWGAWRELHPVLCSFGICLATACLLVGLWFGRPLMRQLVVFLLPPRLRAPMAFLWRADAKPLPRRT